jgi:hypothetical protein
MGFKTDSSFLRFLTMGALGVRRVMDQLRAAGFEPIELERYCASNKIWATKVKRLRLPDLLCVRTGLRVEVRAKSDLKIRMSDAPKNPERRWDSGLRDDDIIAFVAIQGEGTSVRAADEAVFFGVDVLRGSEDQSILGRPKSPDEGAERDRTWPAIIPSRNGIVINVNEEKLLVVMGGDGQPERRQTYTLAGKRPYVRVGDRFKAEISILAGAPSRLAVLQDFRERKYDPLNDLQADQAVDRYAAVKALRYRPDLRSRSVAALEAFLTRQGEEDGRVALEAAASAAAIGSRLGEERIIEVVRGDGQQDLRMESVLILTELGTDFARGELLRLASRTDLEGDELRQAAVWGLGKVGFRAYEDLLPFIDDPAENVALHAIIGFGADTPESVIRKLVADLGSASVRRAAAASEVLRILGSETVIGMLIEGATSGSDWALATLGRLPPTLVRPRVEGTSLLARLYPMLLLGEGANWLASQDRVTDIAFLTKQSL